MRLSSLLLLVMLYSCSQTEDLIKDEVLIKSSRYEGYVQALLFIPKHTEDYLLHTYDKTNDKINTIYRITNIPDTYLLFLSNENSLRTTFHLLSKDDFDKIDLDYFLTCEKYDDNIFTIILTFSNLYDIGDTNNRGKGDCGQKEAVNEFKL